MSAIVRHVQQSVVSINGSANRDVAYIPRDKCETWVNWSLIGQFRQDQIVNNYHKDWSKCPHILLHDKSVGVILSRTLLNDNHDERQNSSFCFSDLLWFMTPVKYIHHFALIIDSSWWLCYDSIRCIIHIYFGGKYNISYNGLEIGWMEMNGSFRLCCFMITIGNI